MCVSDPPPPFSVSHQHVCWVVCEQRVGELVVVRKRVAAGAGDGGYEIVLVSCVTLLHGMLGLPGMRCMGMPSRLDVVNVDWEGHGGWTGREGITAEQSNHSHGLLRLMYGGRRDGASGIRTAAGPGGMMLFQCRVYYGRGQRY